MFPPVSADRVGFNLSPAVLEVKGQRSDGSASQQQERRRDVESAAMKRGAKRAANDPIFPSFTARPNKGGGKQPARRAQPAATSTDGSNHD